MKIRNLIFSLAIFAIAAFSFICLPQAEGARGAQETAAQARVDTQNPAPAVKAVTGERIQNPEMAAAVIQVRNDYRIEMLLRAAAVRPRLTFQEYFFRLRPRISVFYRQIDFKPV